jgi:nuclear protein localization family protein 4
LPDICLTVDHAKADFSKTFRHVDNIMFENSQMVDKFLNYWRRSGNQRIGFLYGHYEAFDGVPLGIKAVVSAIYEPPQTVSQNHCELILPDPSQEKINQISRKLGMTCVGWIFTDLMTEDSRQGTVKNFRGNSDTYFLTADECMMAGSFQNMHKNACRYSSERCFGSKFVTVVVTGDAEHQISFQGYQVSNQCASLVRDECLVPTYDAPELAYIKESNDEKFIPDVYYRVSQ